jgi:hypothetical protein
MLRSVGERLAQADGEVISTFCKEKERGKSSEREKSEGGGMMERGGKEGRIYGDIYHSHCELKPIAIEIRSRATTRKASALVRFAWGSLFVEERVANARRKSFIARGTAVSNLRNFYWRKSNIHRTLRRDLSLQQRESATCRETCRLT